MANVRTYYVSTQGNLHLSNNFIVREFACQDGSDAVLIDLDLVAILQAIRDALGGPVTITSGYRTVTHNANVGGASNSFHTKGMAADIVVSGKTTAQVAACAETVGALGILRYITDGFVHVDTRTEKYFAEYVSGIPRQVPTHGGAPPGGPSGTAATISQIQSTMNSRYNAGLTVDGVFGPATKRALINGLQTELNTQYHAGLVVDGIFGPATKDKCPKIDGGTGNIPYIIQAGLYCIAGDHSVPVDGAYDADTISAVRAFQTQKNLSPVDGITGKNTFSALFG